MRQLVEGAEALGLHLAPEQMAAFQIYYQELVAWNRRFNLTTITDLQQVQVRHFLDSLSCLASEEIRSILRLPGALAIDIGSGAGFPGLPLKIVCPDLGLTLLEATGKKVAFLDHIIRHIAMEGATAVHARAEELAHDPAHREQYDLALARAVADLAVVAEYALPFCRLGGCVAAHKGKAAAAEAAAAQKAINLLGGQSAQVMPVRLPGLAEDRYLVVIRKIGPTPADYPRRPGLPGKRPLR